jgi:hypothetical protein
MCKSFETVYCPGFFVSIKQLFRAAEKAPPPHPSCERARISIGSFPPEPVSYVFDADTASIIVKINKKNVFLCS